MPPAPPEPSELVPRLRQQLILAQVRIMELEDERDQLAPRLAAVEALLRAAQQLADAKAAEAGHLAKVVTDTQAHAAKVQQLLEQAANDLNNTLARLTETEAARLEAEETAASLRAEIAALKATRSWRWTAWLR